MANSASEKKTVVVDVERFVHTRNAVSFTTPNNDNKPPPSTFHIPRSSTTAETTPSPPRTPESSLPTPPPPAIKHSANIHNLIHFATRISQQPKKYPKPRHFLAPQTR
jgi:hypothetical protein